jgi:hypothetical protein
MKKLYIIIFVALVSGFQILNAQFVPSGSTTQSATIPTGEGVFAEVPFYAILNVADPAPATINVRVIGSLAPSSAQGNDSNLAFEMCIGGDLGACIPGLQVPFFPLAPNSPFEVKLNVLNPSVEQDFDVNILVTTLEGESFNITFTANVEVSGTQNISEIMESQIGSPFPNPFNDFVNIPINVSNEFLELAIFDITGKRLIAERVNAGSYNKMIDTSSLPSGLYLISLMDSKGVLTTKKIFKN